MPSKNQFWEVPVRNSADSSASVANLVVIGSGDLAKELTDSLLSARLPHVTQIADDAEIEKRLLEFPAGSSLSGSIHTPLLALVATSTAEPDRIITWHLHRLGLRHLLVRVTKECAQVGPLVLPGTTPCLRCHDLTRSQLDPQWPRKLTQLTRSTSTPAPYLTAWTVSTATAQAKALCDGIEPDTKSRIILLHTKDHCLQSIELRQHPRCYCASGNWE